MRAIKTAILLTSASAFTIVKAIGADPHRRTR